MVDREQLLTILRRRFPDSGAAQLAAAANAILGIEDGWDDVTGQVCESGGNYHVTCCEAAGDVPHGADLRILRRRRQAASPIDPEC